MKYENHVKKAILLMIVIGLLYAGITSVFGVQGATNIDVGTGTRANLTNFSSTASTAVQAGNVTELNVSGSAITDHWAGFFGEITGTITLENSDGDVFYNWSGLNTVSGEVFASNESTLAWGGIGCASAAEIVNLNTALGIAGTDVDSVNATYDSNAHPSLTIGAVSGISGCNSTNAFINTGKDTSTFHQVLLTDTNGYAVYTTVINDTTTGFDGSTHDFQLLVGQTDLVATTTMYFYIEL